MNCTVCKGTGKMSLTVTHGWPGDKDAVEEVSEIDCVWCDGTGEIDKQTAKEIEYEQTMWCECGKGSENPVFWDDGEHDEIGKHHWRCKYCDGVVQIG